MQWLGAWRAQAITSTNVDKIPVMSCVIHQRTNLQEMFKISILHTSLYIIGFQDYSRVTEGPVS